MSGSMTEITRYHFAKDFLEAIGYEYIWDFLGYALVIGFAVSIVHQLFLLSRGEKGDFVGVVIRYALMALFIQFSEPAVHGVTTLFVDSQRGDASIDGSFIVAFNQLQASFNSGDSAVLLYAEKHPSCQLPEILLTNTSIPAASLLFSTFVIRVSLYLIFLCAWIIKVALFSWIWPILYSFTGLGLVSAVVFSSLPGGGRSLFPFFKSMIQLSLWPMLYVAFISLISLPVNSILKSSEGFLLCPTAGVIGGDEISLFVAVLVLFFGILFIPFLASSLMHHQGSESFGRAIAQGAVQLMNGSVQILEKSGGGVVSSGVSSVLSSMSHSVSVVTSQPYMRDKKEHFHQDSSPLYRHTIVSERGQEIKGKGE